MKRDKTRQQRRFTKIELKSIRETALAIYRRVPEATRDCLRRTECCRFRLTGKTPQLTLGEAVVAALGWRASGRNAFQPSVAPDGSCPFLDPAGGCGIYEHRPLGCRTHFCAAAGGPLSRDSVIGLIRELETLDQVWQGDGPKPLESAVGEVWEAVSKAR